MFLVVGLGNPGEKYARTRHNAGFFAVDALCTLLGGTWKPAPTLQSVIAEAHDGTEKIILAKPQTFMNLSGHAVSALVHHFHTEPAHLLVLSDDITLPLGTLRVRAEGSSGGHNGLQSIIDILHTSTFPRVRMGVGTPPPHIALESWVLQRFSSEDLAFLAPIFTHAASLARDIVHGRMHVHTFPAPPRSPTS